MPRVHAGMVIATLWQHCQLQQHVVQYNGKQLLHRSFQNSMLCLCNV